MTTIAAVLAGGSGTRIGAGKPAVPLAGRPLISYPLDAARGAGLRAVVTAKLSTSLPVLGEHVLYEADEPSHPLLGMLSALDYAAAGGVASAVVMLACDMPFVTAPMIRWLAGLDGPVVVRAAGRLQPLLSRVPVEARQQLAEGLGEGRALMSTFERLGPRIVDDGELARFGDPERLCFNVNTPADLRVAAAWLGT